MLKLLFQSIGVTILAACVAFAQTGNATITGRVTDPSGAVILGASITATNTGTNVKRTTTTNQEGLYVIPNLIPGNYALAAEFTGFKKLEQEKVLLQVGDRVTLNLSMEVGSSAESVTVTGEAPLLRTEDAQTGMVIDNRRIQQLPQYNRNALAFAILAANVNGASEQGNYGTDFRINGGRTNQTEYIIDGLPVTTGYKHEVPPAVPSMEAVAEFKVLTNGFAAEYGRLSGGAVVLVSKSGNNEFHGQAYWYFKNDKLNANSWTSNRFGRPKGVFHDNVFGGSIGGPVLILGLGIDVRPTFQFENLTSETRKGKGRAPRKQAGRAGSPSQIRLPGSAIHLAPSSSS